MRFSPVSVVVPPEPVLTPAEVPGSHGAEDATVAAYIAGATGEIDGPTGWLWRSIGPQRLRVELDCWPRKELDLPLPPLIDIVSVTFRDPEDVETTVDQSSYLKTSRGIWFKPAFTAPSLAESPRPIRVTYNAGYNATAVADGGTGPVPEQIRQALIMLVMDRIRTGSASPILRSETVEGIGAKSYLDADRVTDRTRKAVDALLSGLRLNRL